MSFHPSLIVSHPHFNFSSSRTFSISFSTNLHMLLAVHLYDPKIYPCRAFHKYSFTKDTNNKDFPFQLLPFSHPVRNITSSYEIPFKQTYCFCISHALLFLLFDICFSDSSYYHIIYVYDSSRVISSPVNSVASHGP